MKNSETIIFKGSPSQITNIKAYFICLLLIPVFGLGLFVALWVFLKTKFTSYEITTERIILKEGIFSRTTDELEIYRIKDIKLQEPFFLRIVKLSNIELITSDKSSPLIQLAGITEANSLRRSLRDAVEARRDAKGVVERDYV